MKYFWASLLLLASLAEANAQEVESREYGVATTLNFALYDITAANLKVDATDGGTDCSIIKDEGTQATCTNDFIDEGSTYSIALSATEMQAKRIIVCLVDGDATDVFLPKCLRVLTYGTSASAQFVDTTPADVWAAATRSLTDKTGFALSGTQTFNTTGNITGNLSGSVGSVTSVTDKTGYSAACTLGTDVVTAASVSAAAANKISDHVIRRNTSNVEASGDGDTLARKSLLGAAAQQTHRVTVVGDTMTTYRSDGTTILGSRTITSSASAAPITGTGN